MSETITFLDARGEHFAAGFFEAPLEPVERRMGRAMRRHLERCAVPAWTGEPLLPAGPYSVWDQGAALRFHYSFPLSFDAGRWREHAAACDDPQVRRTLEGWGDELAGYPSIQEALPPQYRLGGSGYTHGIIDYGRAIAEGLDGHERRVRAGLAGAGDGGRADLYLALQDLLAGMRAFHQRTVAALAAATVEPARQHLLHALRRVPWLPARTFYEGLVAVNLLFYLDGCDSLGRVDQVLGRLYEADLAAGRLSEDEGEALVRCLWRNVDANNGWNAAIGGSTGAGAPSYNRLTVACLRAAGGLRRPNLALRLGRDAPDEVWDAAIETIAAGCGLPALYNEEAYLETLAATGLVPDADDLADYAFGGCTETMIHGKSNVGSLDGGINLLALLSATLARELGRAPSFEALLGAYEGDVEAAVAEMTAAISRQQRLKAEHHPQLLRTLLVDDCVDRGIEYNRGGARYNWSVVNVGGLSNAVDSLAAVRQVVFGTREVEGAALAAALSAGFEGHEVLRRRLERCPRFGNDLAEADDLAARLSRFVFSAFAEHRPWRGGRFLPGCLMFVTYADAGEGVPATPDGRPAGAPIADSAGPVAGRDRGGPTAMMRSVSRLDWRGAPGTLVVNLRLSPGMLAGPEARAKVRALIRAYFDLGNMQLQINVVDRRTLEAALADPDAYRDLVVRVGGYSEYFHRLSPALRRSLIERTEHGA